MSECRSREGEVAGVSGVRAGGVQAVSCTTAVATE